MLIKPTVSSNSPLLNQSFDVYVCQLYRHNTRSLEVLGSSSNVCTNKRQPPRLLFTSPFRHGNAQWRCIRIRVKTSTFLLIGTLTDTPFNTYYYVEPI